MARLTVNRYPFGPPYEPAWTGGDLDEQWRALGALLAKLDPRRIGINVSDTWPEADGLTYGLQQRLLAVLPAGFDRRLVSAEALVVRWLETRCTDTQENAYVLKAEEEAPPPGLQGAMAANLRWQDHLSAEFVTGRGDGPLHPNTAYAIEGSFELPILEWGGQLLHFKTEQTAIFDGTRVIYLAGRQARRHEVR